MAQRSKKPNWVDKSGKDSNWESPEKLLAPIHALMGGQIFLDAASSRKNPTKAKRFFTKKENGLVQPWDPRGTYINPPFSKGSMPPWTEKILLEAEKGVKIVAVLPCGARYSTRYWQNHIFTEHLKAICWYLGRVPFRRPNGKPVKRNPYDTQIMAFNYDAVEFSDHLWVLGACFEVKRL